MKPMKKLLALLLCALLLAGIIPGGVVAANLPEGVEYKGPYFLNANFTVGQIEAHDWYMGEWNSTVFTFKGNWYSSYPLGSVVKYKGAYYECIKAAADKPAAWESWEPDAMVDYWFKIALPGEPVEPYYPPVVEEVEEPVSPSSPKDADGKVNGKEIIVYYPDWGVYTNYTPATIDWERTTIINHSAAFVGTRENYETDGINQEGVNGQPAPDDAHFVLKTSDRYADMQKDLEHSAEVGRSGIFGEYMWYKQHYPDVKIYLCVGGWSLSFYFSEMISTKEHRTEFIQSCMDFLSAYPCFDGFDFDWEYPGVEREAVIKGSGKGYYPPISGRPEDKENYTLFLKEMREALDAREKKDGKEYGLTACFSPNPNDSQWHEFDKLVDILDYFNLMTYEFLGSYAGKTGHASNLYKTKDTPYSVETAVDLYVNQRGVPREKLNIGAPFTGKSWAEAQPDEDGNVIGVPSSTSPGKNDLKYYTQIQDLVDTGSWVDGYDEYAQASYTFNPVTKEYISYDNARAVTAKAGYINDNDLAGIIIWESRGDYEYAHAIRHPLVDAIYNGFIEEISAPEKLLQKGDLDGDGDYTIDDAMLALNAVSGKITLDAKQEKAADVTGDGKLTIADAIKILNYISEKIPSL